MVESPDSPDALSEKLKELEQQSEISEVNIKVGICCERLTPLCGGLVEKGNLLVRANRFHSG